MRPGKRASARTIIEALPLAASWSVLVMVALGFFSSRAWPREWTSSDGKYKVEAELVRVDGDNAVLERTDGRRISVPIKRLSPEDVRYLESLKEKHPAAGEPGVQPVTPVEGPPPAPTVQLTTWDRAAAKQLALEPPAKWGYRPTRLAQAKPGPLPPVRLQSDRRNQSGILFSAPVAMKCVLMNKDKSREVRQRSAMYREGNELQLYDLTSGKLLKRVALPGTFRLRGLSPWAQTVALTSTAGAPVHLWSLVSGESLGSVAPYGEKTDVTSSNAVATFFPDETHLLTCGGSRETLMTLWSLETGKAVWELEVSGRHSMLATPSPDSRYVAFHSFSDRQITLVDAKTGQVAGLLAAGGQMQTRVLFSSDGCRMAAIARGDHDTFIKFWDLQRGEEIKNFSLPYVCSYDAAFGDAYLLVRGLDRQYRMFSLIDLGREEVIWNYNADADQVLGPAGKFWFMSSSDPITLQGLTLPDKHTLAQLEGHVRGKPIIKSGDAVALEVDIAAPPPGFVSKDFPDSVRKRAVEALTGAGYSVHDDAPCKLKITVSEQQSGSRQMVLSQGRTAPIGRPVGETINVPIHEVRVSLQLTDQQGNVPWSRSYAYSNSALGSRRMAAGGDPLQVMRAEPWNIVRSYFDRLTFSKEFHPTGKLAEIGSSALPLGR